MILWLTELLAREVRTFNVFGYITLRAVLATMTALVISFLVGPKMIAWLTRMRIGQAVRNRMQPKTFRLWFLVGLLLLGLHLMLRGLI